MLQVILLETAVEKLLIEARFVQARIEKVPLSSALGRVLARNAVTDEDIPSFSRAAVDGYAVVAADTFGASSALPALLRLAGEVKMGERPTFDISQGMCAAVWTGGELPAGADAMVMLEDAEALNGGLIAVEAPTAPGRHIVFRGDDARKGQLVLPAGKRLSPLDIGALAALGAAEVTVAARPRVCVLSTGDELVDVAQQPAGAQMRDCNGPMLMAACERAGADAKFLGRVADDEGALLERMRACTKDCDLLLLSGASSAGAKDAAARCLGALGEVFFHGVAVKPGKPTLAGRIDKTLVVGLPGHPAAAYLMFQALVRPLLASLQRETLQNRTYPARLTSAVPSNHGREELVAALLTGEEAEPVANKSGLITTLACADGYFTIPRDTEGLPQGARVDVILF